MLHVTNVTTTHNVLFTFRCVFLSNKTFKWCNPILPLRFGQNNDDTKYIYNKDSITNFTN